MLCLLVFTGVPALQVIRPAGIINLEARGYPPIVKADDITINSGVTMEFERLSIRQRLWIMLSAVFLMGVISMAVDFHQYQNQLVEEKKQQLSALVESQASLLSQLLSNGGDLQEGLSAINGSRYHGEEYFFVINVMINWRN